MSAMSAKLASVKTSIRHNRLNQPADGVFRNCYKVLGLLNMPGNKGYLHMYLVWFV